MKSSYKEALSSKKLWFSVFAISIAFVFAFVAAKYVLTMVPMYETFSGTVIAITAAYLTGNVVNKLVLSKAKSQEPEDPEQKS